MRQIIVTSVDKRPDNSIHLSGVFWLSAPVQLARANPSFTSIVPASTIATWGITQTEASAIQAGLFNEQPWDSGQLPGGIALSQIQNGLIGAYGSAQVALNTTAPVAKYIGASYDGSQWTLPT